MLNTDPKYKNCQSSAKTEQAPLLLAMQRARWVTLSRHGLTLTWTVNFPVL